MIDKAYQEELLTKELSVSSHVGFYKLHTDQEWSRINRYQSILLSRSFMLDLYQSKPDVYDYKQDTHKAGTTEYFWKIGK